MVLTERVLAGRYRLIETIGQGGMAVVHLAHDALLDRDVAVKVLRPGFGDDPQFVERFRREARHAASLHHPNIATIYDTGLDAETGSDYIVMQLVDGPDLQEIIERSGALAVGFAVRVGIETARALAYAHEHGIVHRDIKPANILIDRDGEVRVADFGIARAATDTGATTGGMIGSPQYASPEQVLGEEIGPRSDLYSLGVVLYEALTGLRAFDGPSPAAVALERLRIKPRPIRAIDPAVPRSLERIVMRLLERDPGLRPVSAADVASELEGFRVRELGGVRRPGGRPREATAAVAAAVAGVPSAPGVQGTDPMLTATKPGRRRRRAALVPPGLTAAVAAIALLVVGTMGAIVVLGDGDRGGAVLQETFRPVPSAAAAIVPTPSPSPTPSPVPVVVAPAPSPTASLVTPIPTVVPTARPTQRATPRPTPRPVTVSTSGPARDPAETVDRFYDLVVAHRYDAAAALWSPRMRSEYPPSRFIDGRFEATTRIAIHRLRIERMSVARREAVVYIDITEYRTSGSPRHWFGTWDLVLINGAWRMDDPHLSGG